MTDARSVYDKIRNVTEFTVTDEHLKLLRGAYVGWDDCEFGAPAIDCKRPYGNSDVIADIAEILEVPDDDRASERAHALSEEMVLGAKDMLKQMQEGL